MFTGNLAQHNSSEKGLSIYTVQLPWLMFIELVQVLTFKFKIRLPISGFSGYHFKNALNT